jgi:hypothetical protein
MIGVNVWNDFFKGFLAACNYHDAGLRTEALTAIIAQKGQVSLNEITGLVELLDVCFELEAVDIDSDHNQLALLEATLNRLGANNPKKAQLINKYNEANQSVEYTEFVLLKRMHSYEAIMTYCIPALRSEDNDAQIYICRQKINHGLFRNLNAALAVLPLRLYKAQLNQHDYYETYLLLMDRMRMLLQGGTEYKNDLIATLRTELAANATEKVQGITKLIENLVVALKQSAAFLKLHQQSEDSEALIALGTQTVNEATALVGMAAYVEYPPSPTFAWMPTFLKAHSAYTALSKTTDRKPATTLEQAQFTHALEALTQKNAFDGTGKEPFRVAVNELLDLLMIYATYQDHSLSFKTLSEIWRMIIKVDLGFAKYSQQNLDYAERCYLAVHKRIKAQIQQAIKRQKPTVVQDEPQASSSSSTTNISTESDFPHIIEKLDSMTLDQLKQEIEKKQLQRVEVIATHQNLKGALLAAEDKRTVEIVQAMQHKLHAELAEKKSQREEQIEKVTRQMEAELVAKIAEMDKEAAAKHQDYESKLVEHKRQTEEDLEAQERRYVQDKAKLDQYRDAELTKRQREHEERIHQAQDESQNKLRELEQSYQQAEANLAKKLKDELEARQCSHEQGFAAARSAIEDEHARAQGELEERLAAQRAELDAALAEKQRDYNEEIAEKKAFQKEDLAELQAAYDKQLARLKAKHDQMIERQDAYYSQKLAEFKEDNLRKSQEYAKEAVAVLTAGAQAYVKAKEEAQARHEHMMSTMKTYCDAEMVAQQQRHQEALQALKADYQKKQEALVSKHNQQLVTRAELNARELQDCQKELDTLLSSQHKKVETAMREIQVLVTTQEKLAKYKRKVTALMQSQKQLVGAPATNQSATTVEGKVTVTNFSIDDYFAFIQNLFIYQYANLKLDHLIESDTLQDFFPGLNVGESNVRSLHSIAPFWNYKLACFAQNSDHCGAMDVLALFALLNILFNKTGITQNDRVKLTLGNFFASFENAIPEDTQIQIGEDVADILFRPNGLWVEYEQFESLCYAELVKVQPAMLSAYEMVQATEPLPPSGEVITPQVAPLVAVSSSSSTIRQRR